MREQHFRLAALVAVMVGCGMSAPTMPTAAQGSSAALCPDPGPGISIGGLPGTGLDVAAMPRRRLVLMGGSREDDEASRAFVSAAAGGDIVILRASGSVTSYPNYFTATLAPDPMPSSVLTVLTTEPSAGGEAAVLCRLARAEAVWLAGGDQWNYVGGWPAALHQALAGLAARGVAVGGTSAGAVVFGEAAFDARHGSVTSATALANPWAEEVSISYPVFAQPELAGTYVDSHFMNRDREGRLLAILARVLADRQRDVVFGLGLDERVAIVIEAGQYSVFAPDDAAAWLYELQAPVAIDAGRPLTLKAVRRVRLGSGARGAWPIDVAAAPADLLTVTDGVVRSGIGGIQ